MQVSQQRGSTHHASPTYWVVILPGWLRSICLWVLSLEASWFYIQAATFKVCKHWARNCPSWPCHPYHVKRAMSSPLSVFWFMYLWQEECQPGWLPRERLSCSGRELALRVAWMYTQAWRVGVDAKELSVTLVPSWHAYILITSQDPPLWSWGASLDTVSVNIRHNSHTVQNLSDIYCQPSPAPDPL